MINAILSIISRCHGCKATYKGKGIFCDVCKPGK